MRELAMFGAQGFSTLASGLPGRISRTVLTDKLRKLEDIDLVAGATGRESSDGPIEWHGTATLAGDGTHRAQERH